MRRAALTFVWVLTAAAGAFAQTAPVPVESPVVADIRIHGNYRTPNEEVVRLSGLIVGQPLPPGGVQAVEARLKKSDLFVDVDVRKRFRTLDETGPVAIVIVVQEIPHSVIDIDIPTGPPNPLKRFLNTSMFSPTFEYVDGYGLTYGVRASFVDVLGKEGRLSVPLTWGDRKQVALEADKTFVKGPVSRVTAAGSWSSRENPGYDLDDERKEVRAEIAVPLLRPQVQVALGGGWSDVHFGDVKESFATYGARLVVDTRANPAFPRNAVAFSAGWRAFEPEIGPRVNRYHADAQVYLGLVGSTVLALRGVSDTTDGPLPAYEKALAGGMATLRGFRAGSFVGDQLAAGTVELRLPTHSPMRLGQSGFTIFGDAAAAYDHGTRLADAAWHYGVGAGWYLRAPLISLNLDVAYGIDKGTRVHVTAGFKF
jgi:outer membrane protein assembly factor BamA